MKIQLNTKSSRDATQYIPISGCNDDIREDKTFKEPSCNPKKAQENFFLRNNFPQTHPFLIQMAFEPLFEGPFSQALL